MAAFATTGFTVSPQAKTASPAALMLRAAFTSRSCALWHSGHTQERVAKSSLSSVYPQQEHRLLEGYQRSMAGAGRDAGRAAGVAASHAEKYQANAIDMI